MKSRHEVVVAGGGPTGLMLAGELKLAQVDVAVVERRPTQALLGARAGGLHARTIEVFDQRGIAERFLSQGQIAQVARYVSVPLDMSDFPSRHPYGLGLWQHHIERILAGWVEELGVPLYRGSEITGFTQDDSGVEVMLRDAPSIRADYLAGCDGGRSLVRKTAGIEFAGWDASASWLIAEVEVTEEPKWGMRRDELGIQSFARAENGASVRMLVTEPKLPSSSDEPTLDELSDVLRQIYGTDFGVHRPTSISRFTDMARQATSYRRGRVLLAGDAAHVHHPVGGQGLNIGVQDAVNLGWKLAQVVKGISPESLLDTYQSERHPIAAKVLRTTLSQVPFLRRADERLKALDETLGELMRMEEPRKRFAAMMSGLGVRYDFGPGHALLGQRMPDLEVLTATGPRRVFSFLHSARPLFLNFGAPARPGLDRWVERVQRVDVSYRGAWELPVIGKVTSPAAVLVRPDGYVAWVGEGREEGLAEAIARWFTMERTSGTAEASQRT